MECKTIDNRKWVGEVCLKSLMIQLMLLESNNTAPHTEFNPQKISHVLTVRNVVWR